MRYHPVNFTILELVIIVYSSVAQMYSNTISINSNNLEENQSGFASLADTWEAFERKFNDWMYHPDINNEFGNDDGNKVDFTLPQLRTLLALITIISLSLLLLIISCVFGCCSKKKVPSYLLVQFPLYEQAESSRVSTPIFGRRPCSFTNEAMMSSPTSDASEV